MTPELPDSSARDSGVGPTVFVFEPSPALTVTIEGTSQRSAEAPDGGSGEPKSLEYGDPSVEVHLHSGGQGCWIARMVGRLGGRSLLVGPFGGEPGEVIAGLLAQDGTQVSAVRTAGANAVSISDRRSGERQSIAAMPGAILDRHELDELYSACLAAALQADVAVLTGPAFAPGIPAEVYSRLSADVRALGVPVVADLSGAELSAAVDGGVTVLKASDEDLAAGGHAPSDEFDALLRTADELLDAGVEQLVISRGAEPALAVIDGIRYELSAPRLGKVDHRGAGDSMSAGIAVGIARGAGLLDAVRLGAAAGALNVTRRGLATGRRETIERLAAKVKVRELATDRRSE